MRPIREQNRKQMLAGSIEQSNRSDMVTDPLTKLEDATVELHGIFTRHLSKFPAEQQKPRWDDLEKYVEKFGPAATPAKI